jgi:hypothetical protein
MIIRRENGKDFGEGNLFAGSAGAALPSSRISWLGLFAGPVVLTISVIESWTPNHFTSTAVRMNL